MMARQNLIDAAQDAAHDLADVMQRSVRHDGTRLQLCHIEQIGNEPVEPLRLVDNGCQQIGLLGFGELACKVPKRARRPKYRRKRRLKIMRDWGEERGTDALDCQSALVYERIE